MINNLLHDIEMQAKTIDKLMTRNEVLECELVTLKADLASETAWAKQYSDQSDALLLENNELRKDMEWMREHVMSLVQSGCKCYTCQAILEALEHRP